jgi:carbonic anhydrase
MLPTDPKPARHLAVVTCMDCRLDPSDFLGLDLGDAHVLRNAGGRVTDDVLRSLAISANMLGVDTVAIIEHTKCGLANTEEALREKTGADVEFYAITDPESALRADVDRIAATPYLSAITTVTGHVYDIETGKVTDLVRWERG